MRVAAEVIYQAALVVPPWLGYADFLGRPPGQLGVERFVAPGTEVRSFLDPPNSSM